MLTLQCQPNVTALFVYLSICLSVIVLLPRLLDDCHCPVTEVYTCVHKNINALSHLTITVTVFVVIIYIVTIGS